MLTGRWRAPDVSFTIGALHCVGTSARDWWAMATNGNAAREGTDVEGRMRSMRRWRVAISVGTLVVATVLLLSGNVLIGVLIGGLAIARLVMFSRFPVVRRGARPTLDGNTRGWLRAQARDEVLVASGVMGCAPGEVRQQLQHRKSIAEIAAARGIAVEQVSAAIAADLTTKATAAEQAGTLTPDAAAGVRAQAPRFADGLIHRRRGGRGGRA